MTTSIVPSDTSEGIWDISDDNVKNNEEDDEDLILAAVAVYWLNRTINLPLRPRITLNHTQLTIRNIPDDDCKIYFRFYKNELYELVNLLHIPPVIKLRQRSLVPGDIALCILLKRLSYPGRLWDLAQYFGRPPEIISLVCTEMTTFLHERYGKLLSVDTNRLTPAKLEEFCRAIHEKGAALDNCYGFIDGTVRPIARPGIDQRAAYNGHKRTHALKYQSVTTPDGLIVDLWGPAEGRRHDCFLLRKSNLLSRIEDIAFGVDGRRLVLYGDPAYGVSELLISPFQGSNLAEFEQLFNRTMSSVRESVEWGFQRVVTQFAFVDFKKNQKVGLQPLGKIYLVAALLTNLHGCFYGTQTSLFFSVQPPAPADYLASVNELNL